MQHSVLAAMQAQIEAWDLTGDQRQTFLRCYQAMTNNMLSAIQDGEFEDGEWVETLLEHFASYYFHALYSFENLKTEVPLVWRQAFDAAAKAHISPLQNLILGVNAHINYDLVLALADVLAPSWSTLPESGRANRYKDHCHVNQIIARTVDSVQDEILEKDTPWLDWVDDLLGPVDEWATSALITHWREQVWENAITYLALEDQSDREHLRLHVEAAALRVGKLLLTSNH